MARGPMGKRAKGETNNNKAGTDACPRLHRLGGKRKFFFFLNGLIGNTKKEGPNSQKIGLIGRNKNKEGVAGTLIKK